MVEKEFNYGRSTVFNHWPDIEKKANKEKDYSSLNLESETKVNREKEAHLSLSSSYRRNTRSMSFRFRQSNVSTTVDDECEIVNEFRGMIIKENSSATNDSNVIRI